MKVITNSPIIYSNALGDAIRSDVSSLRKKARNLGDKIKAQKNTLEFVKMLGQTFGKSDEEQQQSPPEATEEVKKEEAKKGMSKGLKIGLIVGGGVLLLIILGVIIHQSTKEK